MYNIRPTHGLFGVGGSQSSQGLYWNITTFGFEEQLDLLESVGAKICRLSASTDDNGNIQTSGSNYVYYRLFGTSPSQINTASYPDTDKRKHNYGWINKCAARGIDTLLMVPVRPTGGDENDDWWTAGYATPQDAYNAGFQMMAGFGTNYGHLLNYIELGNEIELFTKLLNGTGSGNNISHYHIDRLDRAVQYVAGMEDGLKSTAPEITTIVNIAGWLAVVFLDRVFAAAPTINKIGWHWYSEHQARLKQSVVNDRLPGDGKSPAANSFTNIFDYLANRYPTKKIWFTETGYRWSATRSQAENEQRMLDNYISVVNDYNNSTNGEAFILFELMDRMVGTSFSTEKHHGLMGYPNFNTTEYANPQEKLLAEWLQFEEEPPTGTGLKYVVPYKDITNKARRVEIYVTGYTGSVIPLRGVNGGAFILNWQPDEETMSHVVISSSATIQVYQQNDAIDIFELQTAADRDIVVRYYEEDSLKWQGFMVSDGIMQTFQAQPFELQLQAVDGLQLLEGINTTSPNTTATGTPNRAPINYFRDLLWNRLGNELPIRFAVDGLECVVYPDENVMAGSVQWSPRGQGYADENGTAQNAFWAIQGMTDSFFARIYQSDGYWVVERKPSVVTGAYNAKVVDGLVITDVVVNALRGIGKTPGWHYDFVNEDANLTVVKPLLKVSTLYDHTQKENIIPNGNMDETLSGTVLYWSRSAASGFLSIYSGGLNLQGGNGLRVQNNGIFGGLDIYVSPTDAAIEGMPIDAHTLFNTAEFGFTFMPIIYPVTGDGATIDWTSNPMQITIKYTLEYQGGTRDYFLNEFGYWQYEPRGTDLGTTFSYQTQESVPAPNPYNDNRMYFTGNPAIGDVISIGIIRNRYGSVRDYYTVTCEVAEEGNLELFLNKMLAALPPDTGGWDLFNKQVNMADTVNGHIRYSIVVGYGQPEVSTYKGGALQDFQRISITVDSMKLNDVARVQIQSKANEGKILLPDPGDLDNITDENVGRLFVQLHVKDGQDVVFDDVYCNVNENQDLYVSVLQSTNNTAIEDRTLNISSAFSGFFNTNYMTAWTVSNTEYKFSNGVDEGSLTRLHSRDTLKMRCLPSILFSGSINVRKGGWKFGEVYEIATLNGKKFLSLGATYNTEKAEVNLRALEAYYNNDMTIITNHYGSESEPINI